MSKKYVGLFSILGMLFMTNIGYSQPGDYEWSKQQGGTDFDRAEKVVVDKDGNSFTTGVFNQTADFDPGPGNTDLTSLGGQDMYISKLNNDGSLVWAISVGGSSDDYSLSIAIDDTANVYITGFFFGTVDFDPGSGTSALTSSSTDAFVAKYDSTGSFVWVSHLTGAGSVNGYDLTLDNDGNVLVGGTFTGTCDFDPGAGTSNLTSNGLNDGFICKLTPEGSYDWAVNIGGAMNAFTYALGTDEGNAIYAAGSFQSSADLDPGTGTNTVNSVGGDDIFLLKLTSAGNFVWGGAFGSTSQDRCHDMAVDQNGNIYTTGWVQGDCDFDIGSGTDIITGAGVNDCFILKIDSAGTYDWVANLAATNTQVGYGICTDAENSVYTTGFYGGTVDFDPGTGTFNLTADASGDLFIHKLDSNGNFVFAKHIGGAGASNYGRGIAVSQQGNVYTVGNFGSTVDFDPGTPVENLTSFGSEDAFVLKLCQTPSLLVNESFPVLTAVAAGLQYQWVDCSNGYAPISGATSQSFDATSQGNGDYAVILSNGNCTDTSNCYTIAGLSINEADNLLLKVFPNPVSNELSVTFEGYSEFLIRILDNSGKELMSKNVANNAAVILMDDFESGIYLVEVTTSDQRVLRKIVKL